MFICGSSSASCHHPPNLLPPEALTAGSSWRGRAQQCPTTDQGSHSCTHAWRHHEFCREPFAERIPFGKGTSAHMPTLLWVPRLSPCTQLICCVSGPSLGARTDCFRLIIPHKSPASATPRRGRAHISPQASPAPSPARAPIPARTRIHMLLLLHRCHSQQG